MIAQTGAYQPQIALTFLKLGLIRNKLRRFVRKSPRKVCKHSPVAEYPRKKIKKQSSFAQETMHDSSYFDEAHTHKNILQKNKKHKNIQKLADDFLHAASLPLLHTATLAAAILPLGLTVLGEGGLP